MYLPTRCCATIITMGVDAYFSSLELVLSHELMPMAVAGREHGGETHA